MNSLLKRQLRKYLPEEFAKSKDLEFFLDAVDRSYSDFDEQLVMQQRAMEISSEELFVANKQLKQEFNAQKAIIDKLKNVLDTLKVYELPDKDSNSIKNSDLDSLILVDFIDYQTKKVLEINQQREKLLDELSWQNQELSDYAHMVSHDLKSPLRSIDTLSAWLEIDYENKLDDTGQNNLNRIRTNVEKMDTLINGILEYSTISKNKLERYDVDINQLMDDVLNSIEIPEHISIIKKVNFPVIKGENLRLQQLIQNLIENAIKYNDKTAGLIEIGLEDENEFWKFSIKDNGKGIEDAYFDKIFKTFQKLENNSESSGIGLSIVKKIVNFYGGKIWVESEIKVGTTFYFTIKK